ncbi:MBL fold metallo-hydrolase [Candidatus Micrarchaeota archaeon]|nr:MBL fold metallo-hydrolase [Candidatus Micrarchaeota archaeon]
MKIKFLGASGEVGRSSFLVKTDKNYLLDCGIKLKDGAEEFPEITTTEAKNLHEVLLSHAHLDHSGYLPALYAKGYSKKVKMTKPTRDLIQLLLADYLRINKDKNKAYTQKDLDKLLKNIEIKEYNDASDIIYKDAGHILGSATINLTKEKILYTGDFAVRPSRLLEGCAREHSAETIIMESTYGSKKDAHPSLKEVSNSLIKSINSTLSNQGKVIIPTFAIGRGQEILFTIENYMRTKQMPQVPVYLDGMVKKCLRIYRHNAIYLKDEVKHRILTSDDDPFKSEFYKVPAKKDRSDVTRGGPCIIVTTSGMLNGGPVLEYLKELGSQRENKIVLVGYQAEGTNGRKILDGEKRIEIDDQDYAINLQVDQFQFSAHADFQGLIDFAKNVSGLKRAFIVHGEKKKSEELASELEKKIKNLDAVVPEIGEEIEIK